ncbi:MAG: isoprenyl transferase [Myxococcota bacterium]|nr:isoprenyl transferase [Myxococcales bacterium]
MSSERRLQQGRMPRHVAIIMDGNGRWAEARGEPRVAGHRAGVAKVREVIRGAHELGIGVLTLYAFSLENWNRPKDEVVELMRLLEEYIDVEIDEVIRNGIELRVLGRLDRLTPRLRRKIEGAIAKSQGNDEMTLCLALSYGGRAEIVDAARQLMRDAEQGKLSPDDLDEKTFAAYLYDPEIPDPDLLIRTGDEYRISNFLLWQVAYAELYSTPVMWPDFSKQTLVDAILDYQRRERRFGMTSAQVRAGGAPPEGGTSGS